MQTFRYLIIALLATLMFSCAQDDPGDEGMPVVATFELRTETMQSKDPINQYEKITSWWMVFVDKEGTVRNILRRTRTDAVEQERVEAEVATGTYTVYAFANITEAELASATGLSFSIGQKAPSNVLTAEWQGLANGYDKSRPIPMSGYSSIRVTAHVNQTYSIEVVRMVAKMEFEFSSSATHDIEVQYLTITPLSTGNLRLMPDYNSLGGKPSYAISDSETFRYNLETPVTIPAGKSKAHTEYFYVRESMSDTHPTGHFNIGIGIKRNGQNSEVQYALTDSLTYINRNDHIYIPIRFTDYIVEVKANFYPPIGGYPAMTLDEKDEAFYIRFGTQGRFVITPRVRTGISGQYLQASQYTANIVRIDNPGDPADDSAKVLTTEPSIDPVTGEITGYIGNTMGTACVELEITILPGSDDSGSAARQTYRKKIYIIRQTI